MAAAPVDWYCLFPGLHCGLLLADRASMVVCCFGCFGLLREVFETCRLLSIVVRRCGTSMAEGSELYIEFQYIYI